MRDADTRLGMGRTEWFRLPGSWLPLLHYLRARKSPVSIYCGAAATGEEAYSVAILLEHYEIPGRVIATDIDHELIAIARRGVTERLHLVQAAQSAAIAGVLRPMQLLNHFEEKHGEWRPSSAVRKRVTFAVADLRTCEIPSVDVVFVRNAWRHLGDEGWDSLYQRLLHMPSGTILSVGGADLQDEHERPTGLDRQLTGFKAGPSCLFVRE